MKHVHGLLALAALVLALGVGVPATQAASAKAATYDKGTVLDDAVELFGKGAEGIAKVINKAFTDRGEPSGVIKGAEAAGAIGVGLRYGHGTLKLANGATRKVYWQSPSVGFDAGANAAKVFVLVYNVQDVERIFQRYPGIDGSLYVVGGVGLNYHRSGNIILAPIRLGVGWRAGVNVGYLKVTPKKTIIPF